MVKLLVMLKNKNNDYNNKDNWGMKQEKNDDDAWDNKGDEWGSKNDSNNFGKKDEDNWGVKKITIMKIRINI